MPGSSASRCVCPLACHNLRTIKACACSQPLFQNDCPGLLQPCEHTVCECALDTRPKSLHIFLLLDISFRPDSLAGLKSQKKILVTIVMPSTQLVFAMILLPLLPGMSEYADIQFFVSFSVQFVAACDICPRISRMQLVQARGVVHIPTYTRRTLTFMPSLQPNFIAHIAGKPSNLYQCVKSPHALGPGDISANLQRAFVSMIR
jgi:hypothetical protein